MVKVELLPDMTPEESASHAALRCYTSKPPKVGKVINVKERLFDVSHHTTIEHKSAYFTFGIEGISVGDVTFGLHLVSPFYNTDQRSGRYAAKMFTNPDLDAIDAYVKRYWPNVKKHERLVIRAYMENSIEYYQQNISEATEIARKFLKEERPYISQKMLDTIAPKVAQEQLRMFIPVIFPTGLDFTVNLIALVAMWEEAWTPAMKDVTEKMAKCVLSEYPGLSYMFDESRRRKDEWTMVLPHEDAFHICTEPEVICCEVYDKKLFAKPDNARMHPVDRLHFAPEFMDNSLTEMKFEVVMSVATMGQDQRHRTLKRGEPCFTGGFYVPPVVQKLSDGKDVARAMNEDWVTFVSYFLPDTLSMMLAPYGAMVQYTKKGSVNAIAHEQFKRLCWCAQEEIYYLSVLEREKLECEVGPESKLLELFQSPCFESGKCAEGPRYCGRDLRNRTDFIRRKV